MRAIIYTIVQFLVSYFRFSYSYSAHRPPSTITSYSLNLRPIVQDHKDLAVFEILSIFDFPRIFLMTYDHFSPECISIQNHYALAKNIWFWFVPSLLDPEIWEHKLIGMRESPNGALVGFVDFSLQP